MERAVKIRKTDGSWAFCPILPASAGEGDEATEEALDMELREEIEMLRKGGVVAGMRKSERGGRFNPCGLSLWGGGSPRPAGAGREVE